tara:strand:- start:359 stop:541 length:183 start_codon:yes stop_codon:yes gene_type:complete
MTYIPILTDPTEFNGKESEKCERCHNDLTFDEIQNELLECDECIKDQELDDIKTNYKTNN